jgi:predicted ABC-type ATPase
MSQQLWVLVGGNGSGKSTFYQEFLKPLGLPFINADVIAKDLFPADPEAHSYEAAKIAETIRNDEVELGTSFCFETVFSHPSKIDFLAKAKAFNYQIILVFIHLDNTDLNKARVNQRVNSGGHNVPDNKIESRVPRVLENVKTALPLCDQVRVIDNSSADNPFKSVALVRHGVPELYVTPVPEWLQNLLSDFEDSPH